MTMPLRPVTQPAPWGEPLTPAQVLVACLRLPPERLRALCAHPLIDWSRVAAEAGPHGVGPLVFEAIQRSGLVAAGRVPPDVIDGLRVQRRSLVAQSNRLDVALAQVLAALAAEGVPILVLKGPTLARYYPTPAVRPRSDIDLLVEPLHWPAAEAVLVGLGYRLQDADHVRRPLLGRQQAPEDRQFTRARDGTAIELHADYLSTGLLRRDDAGLWRRARTVSLGALNVRTLSPTDTFLLVATHMQRHAYTRLLWFYDLYVLLHGEGEQIDWHAVRRRAERAGVATAAYFALSYTESLFGPIAPAAARAALRPGVLRQRLHERLWPRRRILALDVEIMPRLEMMQQAGQLPPAVFDAYASPARIVAHLLLSGNVWPKLGLLGRRLVPTEEWLRYYGPQRVAFYGLRLVLARLLDAMLSAFGRPLP